MFDKYIMSSLFFPSLNILKRDTGGHVHMAAVAASTTGNLFTLFAVHDDMPSKILLLD